jgi:glycosyltransferase involved in cell wall biosynthesis
MKILQVIPFFSPEFGGSVDSVHDLSMHLAQRGHTVTILTTSYHFDTKYANGIPGVNVIPLPYFFNWGLFIHSPEINNFINDNLRFFDVVILHNYRSYQNAVLSKYAKIYSVPYCMDAHGSLLPISKKQILKRMFDFVWGKKILSNAAGFIAATPEEQQQYVKMGIDPAKISIIPRGIDISNYHMFITENSFRKKYKISADTFLILYLGRIHSIKGLDILINAFSRLTKAFENTLLVIAGPDDGYLLTLKNFISQNNIEKKVIFTGTLYTDEKIMALQTADLVVVPSYYESFGIVVTEAMASKTPVLISNKCGILQMLSREIVHVCECDKDKLYDAIEKLYLDENERKKYVNSAYDYTEINFSWDNVIKQYEVIFENIINDRQTG